MERAVAALGQVNLCHFLPDYTAYEELLDIFKLFTSIPILLEGASGYHFGLDELERRHHTARLVPWDRWHLWQYTGDGKCDLPRAMFPKSVANIRKAERNIFLGSLASLQAFWQEHAWQPAGEAADGQKPGRNMPAVRVAAGR